MCLHNSWMIKIVDPQLVGDVSPQAWCCCDKSHTMRKASWQQFISLNMRGVLGAIYTSEVKEEGDGADLWPSWQNSSTKPSILWTSIILCLFSYTPIVILTSIQTNSHWNHLISVEISTLLYLHYCDRIVHILLKNTVSYEHIVDDNLRHLLAPMI